MKLTSKRAARARIQALSILQARHAFAMLEYIEYFPRAGKLVQLSLRLLGRRVRNETWRSERILMPVLRVRKRSWLEPSETRRVNRIIQNGWWLMAYEHTLGINLTPDNIINGQQKKEN